MAGESGKTAAAGLLGLNLCMYIIVASLGGWALNVAINRGFIIGSGLVLPAHFVPIFFPIGNHATGFFVIFALIASVVGAAAALAGVNHLKIWSSESLSSASSSAFIAWGLTLLAMGLACKEIEVPGGRNAKLKTMEAFMIILSVTQFLYIVAIRAGSSSPIKR